MGKGDLRIFLHFHLEFYTLFQLLYLCVTFSLVSHWIKTINIYLVFFSRTMNNMPKELCSKDLLKPFLLITYPQP